MNGVLVGENQRVVDEDASILYRIVSECTGQTLEPNKDKIVISRPDKQSRSATSHFLLCKITEDRYVGLKRCCDNDEFMRREVAINAAKKQLGFPSYNVIQISGIKLTNAQTMATCNLLSGWEQKTMLVIDFGKYKLAKNFTELRINDINNLGSFCHAYGRWAAFNYLLTVRDRNAGNFVFFLDSQILHSIDNEEGPFDSNGIDGGVLDIVTATRQNIEKFIVGTQRVEYIRHLRKGFKDGYDCLRKSFKELHMFNPKEFDLIRQRIESVPPELGAALFP